VSGLPAASAIHPRIYRTVNALLPKLWASRLSPPADLDTRRLFDQARRRTGLDDFGADDGWRDRLALLIRSLRDEAKLNAIGMTIAHGTLINRLADRLRFVEHMKRRPAIGDRPLSAPVVICGHMRSGTTRLQRLMACDDRLVHTRLFETLSPVPPLAGRDRRAAVASLGAAFLRWVNPGTMAAHPTAASEPEEETGLLEFAFWGAQIEAQRRVPGFARHCEHADATHVYRGFADLLRLNGWHRGDDPAKPWLLKSPQYLQDLPALTAALPGARLVFMDRDPAAMIASGASLVWNQMVVQSDVVDPHWIGREWLAKTALREARARAFRAVYPPHLQLQLGFDDFERDWRAAIARVYAFIGLPLGQPLLAKMQAYLDRAAREHGYARHRYRLDDFGLTHADVDAALSASSTAAVAPASAR
jgi:hypothetical protein